MKKFLSILLAMIICMSMAACGETEAKNEAPADPESEQAAVSDSAEEPGDAQVDEEPVKEAMSQATASKSRENMTEFTVKAENTNSDDCFIGPVLKADENEYKDLMDICKEEVEALSASESCEKYFGTVINKDGEEVDLKKLLSVDELNVFEFCPVISGGFKEGCGNVEVEMLFATPYDKDEKVVVMVGIVTENEDGTRSIEWTALDGIGIELNSENVESKGCIKVELTEEMVLEIQEKAVLLAVVSD